MAPNLSDEVQQAMNRTGVLGSRGVFSNFLISASTDGDSLTLWRNYGGDEVAYAIGLDRSERLAPLEQSTLTNHPFPPAGYGDPEWEDIGGGEVVNTNPDPDSVFAWGAGWRNVDYISGPDDPAIQDWVDDLLRDLAVESSKLPIPWAMFPEADLNYMKHHGFHDENEVRQLFWVNPTWKFVLHRPSRFGLIPYIELTGSEGGPGRSAATASKLPIRAITIGPNPFPEGDARRSLGMFLEHHGYSEVELHRSVTPYR